MTTVYLIRHAEAEGNLCRRCHGHYDSTITDNGYRQIAALAKRLEGVRFDAVYASDLTRTQTTALAVTRTHGLPLRIEPRLREVGVGPWEDRTWTWLGKFDRERLVAFNSNLSAWRVEGAETIQGVRDRMLAALRDIVAAHPGETVAAVSHGMALRTLVGTLQGMSLAEIDKTGHAENTAVTKLECDEQGIRVLWRDDAAHLPDELTTLHKQLWTKTKGGLEPGVWFAPDEAKKGRFIVMREDERAGAVAVEPLGGTTARITEFRLDGAALRRNLGVRLVGQAISYARPLGCDTLRVELSRDNARGLDRAAAYGFTPVGAAGELVVFEKYFGYDPAYRLKRFDEAYQTMKNDG